MSGMILVHINLFKELNKFYVTITLVSMTIEKFIFLLLSLIGLFFILRFRSLAGRAIDQRKRLEKVVGSPRSQKAINENSIIIAQILYIIVGLVFFLVGFSKIFFVN